MKKFIEFEIEGKDGKKIKAFKLEAKKPVAVFHLIHGLSEYSERYLEFANFLYEKNISVYSLDNRGFGKNLVKEDLSDFSIIENGEIKQILSDHIILSKMIKQDNIPLITLGHSFGSFIAQKYIQEYHDDSIVFLSGSVGKIWNMTLFKYWTNLMTLTNGAKNQCRLINWKITDGSEFKESPSSPADWLTSDKDEREKYMSDPYCNKRVKIIWWRNMFQFMKPTKLYSKKGLRRISKDVKLVLFSGDKDKINKDGKGLEKLFKMYQNLKIKDVQMKLYKDKRHEMLFETNKYEVYDDIYNQIKKEL